MREHNKIDADLKAIRAKEKEITQTLEDSNELLLSLHAYGEQLATVIQVIDADNILIRLLSGPRYLVNRRSGINPRYIKSGTRVSVSLSTYSIMHILPPQMDESIYSMSDAGTTGVSPEDAVTYADIGGLHDEIKLIKESIELPLRNPDIFKRVGIKPQVHSPLWSPGNWQSLICKCLANSLGISYIKCVGSQLIRKYIGESARLVRDLLHMPNSRNHAF